MSPDGPRPVHWPRSLRTRLLVFLSVALLPLGVIAVFQTIQVIEETQRLAERDALSRTAQAADEQQVLLERAFGAAFGIGQAAANLTQAPGTCSEVMSDFIDNQSDFVFAGFINADGIMDCTNTGKIVDYRGRPIWDAFIEEPETRVDVNRNGEVSGQSVYIVFVPILDTSSGALRGVQAISIPHALTETLFADEEDSLDLALIDSAGTILASSTGMDDLDDFERRGVAPERLRIPAGGLLYRDDRLDRFDRPAAVVPLVAGEIYVLGLWTPGGMNVGVTWFDRTVPVFPLLMWLASLGVAYFTVNNLILTPLSRLSRQMRRYRADRPGGAFVNLPGAPSEIVAIADSYNTLLERVSADTAKLQENVAEKEMLLREVHHRVKNNLQLISSILNMQMRGVEDETARRILSRVQDRVMSLSSVHRALYTGNQLQSVRADDLLDEIIRGIVDLGWSATTQIALNVDLAPIRLDPDQAVPLSLLVTEAMTNAVKYVGPDADGTGAIDVSLRQTGAGEVVFDIRNTRGPAEEAQRHDGALPGTGLGARLIKSFASQLGGEVEIGVTDTAYDLRLRFKALAGT
ncbi:MAG: sensor histidine kinase [Roseicyclus sp.]